MQNLRALLHGFALTFINIFAVLAGFAAWQPLRTIHQLAVQVPVAAGFSVGLFLLWARMAERFFPAWMLRARPEYARAFIAALLWNPILFTSIHFITQGYLTAPGNITAFAFFQLPVNFIAIQVLLAVNNTDMKV